MTSPLRKSGGKALPKWRWLLLAVTVAVVAFLFYLMAQPLDQTDLAWKIAWPLAVLLLYPNYRFWKGVSKAERPKDFIKEAAGFVLFLPFVESFLVIHAVGWLSSRFVAPQTMLAEIAGYSNGRRSCRKWDLRLESGDKVGVCITAREAEHPVGSRIRVAVRKGVLAYEVRYLSRAPGPYDP